MQPQSPTDADAARPVAVAHDAASSTSGHRHATTGAWLLAVAAAYVTALLWIDRDRHILTRLSGLTGPLAAILGLVLLSYLCRYARWRWLLHRRGERFGRWHGWLGYLSGFAFTATPGKAGELIRIRYFLAMSVPASRTLGTFVFERTLDLLVILALSLSVASRLPAFGALAGIVLGVVMLLVVASSSSAMLRGLDAINARLPGQWIRRAGAFLIDGLRAMAPYWRPTEIGVGLAWGALAWGLTSLCFVWLCHALGLALPWTALIGLYPLAMLIGALSFVPGGVGTTEAAIVWMLSQLGVDTTTALTAAIGIRLATLWFAVLVGVLAMLRLERRFDRLASGARP